jgi:capsule polysaccharide modification protein KpsS
VSFSIRNIATIAVFYALPVVQLVITYQTVRRHRRRTSIHLMWPWALERIKQLW